jgi:hypothetical protein
MTFEDPEDRTIFSLLRLRFPSPHPTSPKGRGVEQNSILKILPELK